VSEERVLTQLDKLATKVDVLNATTLTGFGDLKVTTARVEERLDAHISEDERTHVGIKESFETLHTRVSNTKAEGPSKKAQAGTVAAIVSALGGGIVLALKYL